MIGRFHDLAIDAPFGLAAQPDNHQPTNVIADLYAFGLGLPDRDYYLKPDPRFEEARRKYKEHVANTLELAGYAEAESLAGPRQPARPQATDHKTTFAELQKLAPRFDWPAYFEAARLPRADLNVNEPKFLKELDRQLAEVPLSNWKQYLKWHLLSAASPTLSY